MINYNFFNKNAKKKLVISKKESLKFVNAYLKKDFYKTRKHKINLLSKPALSILACSLLSASVLQNVSGASFTLFTLLGVKFFLSYDNFKYEFRNNNDYLKLLKEYRLELVQYLMDSDNLKELDCRKRELSLKLSKE